MKLRKLLSILLLLGICWSSFEYFGNKNDRPISLVTKKELNEKSYLPATVDDNPFEKNSVKLSALPKENDNKTTESANQQADVTKSSFSVSQPQNAPIVAAGAMTEDLQSPEPVNFPMPITSSEISSFIDICFARSGLSRFPNAVEEIFESEVRETNWADSIENSVDELATNLRVNQFLRGKCKSSLCVYDLGRTGETSGELRKIGSLLTKDKRFSITYMVGSRIGDNLHETLLIYRLEKSASYIELLHKKLNCTEFRSGRKDE